MPIVLRKTTKLVDYLDSKRAASALKNSGYVTVGDLDGVGIDGLAGLSGVGDRTVAQLREITAFGGLPRSGDGPREGDDPVILVSPYTRYAIWLLKGERVMDHDSGAHRIVKPLVLEFEDGRVALTREKWLMRLYKRDRAQVQDHITQGLPWRKGAIKWISSRKRYGMDYTVE